MALDKVTVLDRITVPNLSAAEIVAQAKSKLELTHLNPNLATWGFVTDEAGKTYEVMVVRPGHYVSTDEARKLFPEDFTGNTAAFIAWVTEKNPMGWHVSIPEDDRLCPLGDSLCAPRFYRDGDYRSLDLCHVDDEWDACWCFWAFREVTEMGK